MEKLIIFVAVLPVLVMGYTPRTEYIEDYCGTGVFSVSKDFLLKKSDVSKLIPGGYHCAMTIQNKASSRRVQVRVLQLDLKSKSSCSSGAVIIREGNTNLTPPNGLCGYSAPSTKYRTSGSSVTIEFINKASGYVYGDFTLLVTAFYNVSNNSSVCYGDDFKCDNGLCISSQLICNGYDDCGDNSDEAEGCALAVGVVVAIVFVAMFAVLVLVSVVYIFGHRRRRYTRVTEVVREYPSVKPPVAGSYAPSYSVNHSYQTL